MIRISKITRGRWGNQILQYNTLVQLENNLDIPVSFYNNITDDYGQTNVWKGLDFFKKIHNTCEDCDCCGKCNVNTSPHNEILLPFSDVLDKTDEEILCLLEKHDLMLDDPSYCLHNVFFHVTRSNPRKFLEIQEKWIPELSSIHHHIGIHIRGGDVIPADNGREIHNPEYYIKCIEDSQKNFDNPKFYICTDDTSSRNVTFNKVVKYMNDHSIPINTTPAIGNQMNYLRDFALLCYCDVLISSSSTFVVCAGFLGKENKKIYHSKEWIDKNIKHEPWNNKPEGIKGLRESFDNFWIEVSKGGNEYYKPYKVL